MDRKLRGYLNKGEYIRWQGNPARFELLEGVYHTRILGQWILAVLFGSGTLVAYLSMDGEKNPGVIGLVLLVAVVLILSPLMERRNIRAQHYWITDQRLILMCRDKSLYYMPLQEVDACRIIRDQTEWPCLAVGGAVLEDAEKQLRWRACHPKVEMEAKSTGECAAGMIFYGIKNADAAWKLLQPYLKRQAA
ncbi:MULTISPECIES: hypothetical protein [environmental samples]|uniref:hypothetical protein n=1 Tax=environmental samples TaxID=876090 RepID=UPI00033A03DF|nr:MULTISPECIES: hypothetical protein [environmental samples]CDC73226.1 putative uncharacterized protein [Oscillibacter sp. CAG:155]